jgi:hypothetical protein
MDQNCSRWKTWWMSGMRLPANWVSPLSQPCPNNTVMPCNIQYSMMIRWATKEQTASNS